MPQSLQANLFTISGFLTNVGNVYRPESLPVPPTMKRTRADSTLNTALCTRNHTQRTVGSAGFLGEMRVAGGSLILKQNNSSAPRLYRWTDRWAKRGNKSEYLRSVCSRNWLSARESRTEIVDYEVLSGHFRYSDVLHLNTKLCKF